MDDLKAMREKAAIETKITSKTVLAHHPWYNELINKVVVLNGAKRDVTSHENVILNQIKR